MVVHFVYLVCQKSWSKDEEVVSVFSSEEEATRCVEEGIKWGLERDWYACRLQDEYDQELDWDVKELVGCKEEDME